jgi:outer membrane immunogenic protein
MRKFSLGIVALAALAGSPAFGADVPVRTPPPAAPPIVLGWGGCYFGVAGGFAWGRSRAENDGTDGPFAITGDFDVRGGLIGGTTGCSLLVGGGWVFGVESDLSWISKKGTANDLPAYDPTTVNETRESWLSTTRARIGYAWSNWLLYATGGAAVSNVKYSVFGPNVPGVFSEKHTRAGWTVGAGIEWAFTPSWSAKIEYLYVDFGGVSYFDPPPPACGCANRAGGVFLNDNIVRLGVNWRFNLDFGKAPAPVVAKY